MKRNLVVYSGIALRQLESIEDMVARRDSPAAARKYILGILAKAETLEYTPHRGASRRTRHGRVRTLEYKRNITISLVVRRATVEVLHVAYAGQTIQL